jgi:hypothetical protein
MAHGADAPRRRSDRDRSVTGHDNKKSVWQALRSELLKVVCGACVGARLF